MSTSDRELLGDTGVRWSAASIKKAENRISEEAVRRDATYDDVFYVESTDGQTIYRVQTDGKQWASCTCPNGQRTSRPSCYHLAAVLMMLQDEQRASITEDDKIDSTAMGLKAREEQAALRIERQKPSKVEEHFKNLDPDLYQSKNEISDRWYPR